MTEFPIPDDTLEEWLSELDEKKKRIRAQSKDVASYLESNDEFYEWFSEIQGFSLREEWFWGDCERADKSALFEWIRWGFHMGYLAGKRQRD